MSSQYVGAIDQGTTSSRFIVFAKNGSIVASTNKEHKQIYPKPGWVEHDPMEIWEAVQHVVGATMEDSSIDASMLAAVGITNQRETTLVWNKRTGEPLYNAIVWQDQRTAHLCKELQGEEGKDRFRQVTGLPLSPYFAGTKIRWILDNVSGAREAAEAGDAVFGTIDTWLIWNLTGGVDGGTLATDVTNASRTLLMNIDTLQWDDGMCDALGVPKSMLPPIRASSERLALCSLPQLRDVPLSGVLGDQQAALFGQACFSPGEAKNTYGTGCFLLSNTGPRVHSTHGLLTTVAYQRAGEAPVYALEGGVAVAGALVQWLRDNLGLIESAPDVEALAKEVEDNGDVYFVPAFSGLFAPHWRGDARGTIVGLTGFANKGHIARAVLEATAYQTRELVDAMAADSGTSVKALKVDGGMIGNETLMQFQADILGSPVVRGEVSETTALGAAFAAGLAEGFWADLDEVRATWRKRTEWAPAMEEEDRTRLFKRWKKAVARSLDWAEE